jgi:hypothetical protein
MKLEAWLRQEHSLGERLRVVERLSQAVNEVHDGGEALAALEPGRIDVASDGRCDLSAARRGSPRAGYTAPERGTDDPPSNEADVYAAGAIAWEILAGRPCGGSPTHLAQVRTELPREIADAVMGCLESSPEWRPKDLTYLAQLAAAHQGSTRRGGEPEQRASQPARAGAARAPGARASRSHRPLFLAAALVLVAAAGSYTWIEHRAGRDVFAPARAPFPPPQSTPRATPPPPPAADLQEARPTPVPPAALASTPAPTAGGAATTAAASAPAPTPPPVAHETPTPARLVEPTPTPAPSVIPQARATAAPVVPPPTLAPTPTPVPLPAEPPVLSTLSPLSAQRPGKILFDLRGTGLHEALRARILPVREVPRGIVVTRQKWVDATLITVLVELDSEVKPGVYAITLEDAAGRQAKPLTFTVTR